MKTLLQHILIIVLPISLLLSFPVYVLYKTGEFKTPKQVIGYMKQSSPYTYGLAYSDPSILFKVAMVREVRPTVLALGNSKILTMRKEFFNDSVVFYNAGGTAGNIANFRAIVASLPVKPRVIFMTVEPLHFDPAVRVATSDQLRTTKEEAYVEVIGNRIIQSWGLVYRDFLAKKFSLNDITSPTTSSSTPIGLNAYVTGSGIRNDGSYHYGKQYEDKDLRDKKIAAAINYIIHKDSIYSTGEVSHDALKELDAFLSLCKEEHIYVVGYIPPTPKKIEDAYKNNQVFSYMFNVYDVTDPIFKKYGFRVFNFFQLASLGGGDEETIDEYHTSEKIMLRTLLQIYKSDGAVRPYINEKKILSMMLHAQDQNDVTR